MMAISIVAMIGAMIVRRRLAQRLDSWSAALIAAVTYILIVAVAQFSLPDINEVPEGFPAVVLWQFRIASLGMQFVMWAAIGLIFGAVTERALEGARGLPANRILRPIIR